MSWYGILENIISEFIFIFIGVVLPFIFIVVTRQLKLKRFFRISENNSLTVYLSNLEVLPFGSIGLSNRKFSFSGEAVSYREMQVANDFQSLFSFPIPKLAKFLYIDTKTQLSISPTDEDEIETESSFISLGSPVYNAASIFIESLELNAVHFEIGIDTLNNLTQAKSSRYPIVGSSTDASPYDRSTLIPSGTADAYDQGFFSYISEGDEKDEDDKGTEKKVTSIIIDDVPAIQDINYGFVQRIVNSEIGTSYFYIAGLTDYGTMGAGYYLISEWSSLYKKYKDEKSFLIMLRFDEMKVTKWKIVFEREL